MKGTPRLVHWTSVVCVQPRTIRSITVLPGRPTAPSCLAVPMAYSPSAPCFADPGANLAATLLAKPHSRGPPRRRPFLL